MHRGCFSDKGDGSVCLEKLARMFVKDYMSGSCLHENSFTKQWDANIQ